MAYHLPGFDVPHQHPHISKPLKDFVPHLPVRPNRLRNMHFNRLDDDSWRSLLDNHDELLKVESMVTRPVIIDLHGSYPDSILISRGISENFSRNEDILRNLALPFSETRGSELDLAFPSPDVGIQSSDWQPQAFSNHDLGISYDDEEEEDETVPFLIVPNCDRHTAKHGLDCMGHLSHNLKTVIGSENQVLFKEMRSEVKDIQSIIDHYNLVRKTHLRRKQSVVPYFFRRTKLASINKSTASSTTKVKSPEKVMNKPLSRRSSTKSPHQRSPHASSYSHACEILLSLIMNKGQNEKTMLLSLKKSGPELPELLTRFSVLIAGTGLSVILTVVAKIACGTLPISSSKVLSTSMGFGLLWLSMGVNKLRDTIINISRSSGKLKFVDEPPMSKVDESINAIFFRAAILMVLMLLKLS